MQELIVCTVHTLTIVFILGTADHEVSFDSRVASHKLLRKPARDHHCPITVHQESGKLFSLGSHFKVYDAYTSLVSKINFL